MVTFPCAKLNLGLEILRKRLDGFHDIDSVFYPIPFHDALEAVPERRSFSTHFHFSGMEIPGRSSDNLIAKALEHLRKETVIPPLTVFLHKAIPMGAGLGGGSSDAAFFLKLVNSLCDQPVSLETLEKIAAELGSDCSFFLDPRPKRATGRGEKLEPIELDLTGKKLVVVCPEIHVSTAEAYAGVTPREDFPSPADIVKLPMVEWQAKLVNRFEESVFVKYPELKYTKEHLISSGAIYASMTGSGSAIFGIFDEFPTDLDFGNRARLFKMTL
jgi:4-diphosphocytidyl-2-C-methyl-D-erythritol kinase